MRPDPVALCVIRFQRRGQGVEMTVKTSHDVDRGGLDVQFATLDVEDVVETVRSLAWACWVGGTPSEPGP